MLICTFVIIDRYHLGDNQKPENTYQMIWQSLIVFLFWNMTKFRNVNDWLAKSLIFK